MLCGSARELSSVDPDHVAFVLLRPIAAGNVGAAARALKNMGFADLRLVAPQCGQPREALAMAVHARDVIENASIHGDLASAVADATLTIGTTRRMGRHRGDVRLVRAAAPWIAEQSRSNRIAIIFGPEDRGLTNAELRLCQHLVTIPAVPDYPSLNLAQAVMIVAYELMLAGPSRAEEAALSFAPAVEVDAMMNRMREALTTVGFLAEDNPDRIMSALKALFARAGLMPREVDILNGIVSQILWFAGKGHETVEAKRRAGIRLR
jgi:tRNA/rRNA methyltransferase